MYLSPLTGDRPGQRQRSNSATRTPSETQGCFSGPINIHPSEGALESQIEEFYEWSPSDAHELAGVGDSMGAQRPAGHPETPRRVSSDHHLVTPGKRKMDEMLLSTSGFTTPPRTSGVDGVEDDIFTRSTSIRSTGGLFARFLDTPSPVRFKDGVASSVDATQMSTNLLEILQKGNTTLTPHTGEELIQFCNKHVLYVQGLIKGRDLSRSGIEKKQERIIELQVMVERLQAEQESARAVIKHLGTQLGRFK